MTKKLSLIVSMSTIILISGCSLSLTNQEPMVQQEPIQSPVQELTHTGDWIISGGNYMVESVSGSKTTTYSGDLFTTVKITDNSSQRRTYFTSYSGQWSDFEMAREANMFPEETANTITNSLSNQAFGTLTGTTNDLRYHVQVPIDRTLLVHQTDQGVFVLDFDDPSGLGNKMTYKDIQNLIQHIVFTI